MKTAFAIAAAYLVSIAAAPATTLFFDDLQGGLITPTNYAGFRWSGWVTVNGLIPGYPSAYPNAVVSPSNVVGNVDGRFATLSNSAAFLFFNLDSADLTAAYNDGLHIEVQGFSGNTMVYDQTYTVDTTGPTLVNFNYAAVNAVKFISSGGTLHPGYPNVGPHVFNFAMDNLTVTIPEPGVASLLLTGSAAAGLYVFKRNRRQGG